MQPSAVFSITVLTVVAATNCLAVSVAEPPAGIDAIGLPGTVPNLSSSTVTLLTAVGALLVILYVYSTSPPPAGRSAWQSPPSPVVPSQVSVPSVGSFSPTSVHSGDGGPLVPVVLSGLEESRHIGLHSARFVSGVARHEQLVCRTSAVPLMVTVVFDPSF